MSYMLQAALAAKVYRETFPVWRAAVQLQFEAQTPWLACYQVCNKPQNAKNGLSLGICLPLDNYVCQPQTSSARFMKQLTNPGTPISLKHKATEMVVSRDYHARKGCTALAAGQQPGAEAPEILLSRYMFKPETRWSSAPDSQRASARNGSIRSVHIMFRTFQRTATKKKGRVPDAARTYFEDAARCLFCRLKPWDSATSMILVHLK